MPVPCFCGELFQVVLIAVLERSVLYPRVLSSSSKRTRCDPLQRSAGPASRVWPSSNPDAPSLAKGNLAWVVDPFPLVRLYVQMVWILATGNFSVLLVCLTTPTTHASSLSPNLSAVTQLRVFLVSSYNWLYPHPVMVQGVRSRKPLLFQVFLLPYSPSRVGCQEQKEAGSEQLVSYA